MEKGRQEHECINKGSDQTGRYDDGRDDERKERKKERIIVKLHLMPPVQKKLAQ